MKIKKNWKVLTVVSLCAVGMMAGLACSGSHLVSEDGGMPEGALKLSKEKSSLQVVATKNEKVPVTVRFPDVSGYATLGNSPGAWVKVQVDTLDTGNPVRDQNVRENFFDILKKSSNKEASFRLSRIEGDLSSFKTTAETAVTAYGDLVVHGSKLSVSGPMALSMDAQGVLTAQFKGEWSLSIHALGMSVSLKNLNKICPQPHRVADAVAMSGSLVFEP